MWISIATGGLSPPGRLPVATGSREPKADGMHLLLTVLLALTNALLASSTATPRWGYDWPVPLPHNVIRGFEAPPHAWSAGHRGVDLLAASGVGVLAAGPGVVSFSGEIAGRGVLTVRHPDGRRTTYEPLDDRLADGSQVSTGTPLGRLSEHGSHCAPRACLHWGLLVGDEEYRDPLTLVSSRRIVLLPPS